MNAVEVHDHARKLYTVQGAKALAEAAQMIQRYEKTGDERCVEDWRRIELALLTLRGASIFAGARVYPVTSRSSSKASISDFMSQLKPSSSSMVE